MLLVCVIKDEKSGGYKTPFFMASIADVRRQMIMGLRGQDTMVAQFPADFSVWVIGHWNPESGQLDILFEKEFLFNMASVLEQPVSDKKQGESGDVPPINEGGKPNG